MSENKMKEALERFLQGDKKLKIFLLLGIIGIALILLSELLPASQSTEKSTKSEKLYSDYVASLEKDTAELISSVNGAGRCRVMITLRGTGESVFAKNSQESNSESSFSSSYEYVLYDGKDGDEPVLIKQYFPKVQGIAVVCDGADNPEVRESIINCLSSLYNLPVSKISVTKYKG
jgi:stage III sporulation protein AG